MTESKPPVITPDPALRRKVESKSGETISACYQCEKCTNGCPSAFAMDIVPHRVMRMVHFGQVEPLLRSKTIWVCSSCETCSTRCPNGIDIAHVMDTLRQLSTEEGKVAPSEKNAPVFHKEFLASIKKGGRINEMDMITRYTLKSEGISGLMRQSGMGLKMLRRGKFKLLPEKAHGKAEVKQIFKKTGVKP